MGNFGLSKQREARGSSSQELPAGTSFHLLASGRRKSEGPEPELAVPLPFGVIKSKEESEQRRTEVVFFSWRTC